MSSFGEQLKRERELRKVSLEEIAEATKISVRYLRALEINDFSQLPGGVFDRGFVRAYAQFVGLDEEATVEAYLAERGPDQVVQLDDGLDALRNAVEVQPGRGGSPASTAGNRRLLRWVAVGIVAVGLVSVTGWALARYFRADGASPEPPRQTARVTEQSAEQQLTPASTETSADEQAPEAKAPPEPEPQPEFVPEPEIAAQIVTPKEPVVRQAEPAPTTPIASTDDSQGAQARIDARILIDRPATGRVNCDNKRVEMLDGLRPGTVLTLKCQRFLLLNVRDGGAVRVGLNGKTPMQLTADGQPLDNYGIYP
jgi:cytoskeletal protein RodZ